MSDTSIPQPTAQECLQALADAAHRQQVMRELANRIETLRQKVQTAYNAAAETEAGAIACLRRLAHQDPAAIRQVSLEELMSGDRAEARVSALEAEALAIVAAAEGAS